MSIKTLIDIMAARTPEAEDAARLAHLEATQQERVYSADDILTDLLRDSVDDSGAPILAPGERAVVEGASWRVVKAN